MSAVNANLATLYRSFDADDEAVVLYLVASGLKRTEIGDLTARCGSSEAMLLYRSARCGTDFDTARRG